MPLGVERVNTIVFCRHEYDVVAAFSRNLQPGHVERLSVNGPINFEREEFSKLICVHIERRERGLAEVGPGASVVVLGCRDLSARSGRCQDSQNEGQDQPQHLGS